MAIKILLKYKESYFQLEIQDLDNIYDAIEDSLKKTGWSGILALHTDSESNLAELTNLYFLQRWSHK